MLVEINLLPKKEPKNIALLFWGGIIFAVIIVFVMFFFFTLQDFKQQLNHIDQKIKHVQALQATEQAKKNSDNTYQDFQKLQSVVDWANQYPIKTVPILQKLTRLLPKYGYIQAFSYTDHAVSVVVQFDTNEETAYYLKRLVDSKYFNNVTLVSVKTASIQVGNDQTTSNASAANQANAEDSSNTTSDSEISKQSDEAKQTDTTNQTSTENNEDVTDTSGTVSASKTADTTDSGDESGDSSDLLRYTATYTLQLNQSSLKELSKEEKK
ncbi:PilN domain-containing protein [Heyndrickxia ginsengihumi]|uniref:PilN domain-containing protein n=1 Tax=Heyndrickxia ginsengihumi TaxID=363870 RepID=UPI003D203209